MIILYISSVNCPKCWNKGPIGCQGSNHRMVLCLTYSIPDQRLNNWSKLQDLPQGPGSILGDRHLPLGILSQSSLETQSLGEHSFHLVKYQILLLQNRPSLATKLVELFATVLTCFPLHVLGCFPFFTT